MYECETGKHLEGLKYDIFDNRVLIFNIRHCACERK